MRILLVNWAPIWEGAAVGGGVNQYCQALALELVKRGHEVASLFGGTTFVRRPKGCFVRRHGDWMGIRVFEVINSPVMAPSIVQFGDPLGEMSAPELEAQVAQLVGWLKPDAVHFNNIEGFSAGCVEVCRAAGARVLFSLHNYHTICPQVYLMQKHRETCYDADNGHNCATCVQAVAPRAERQRLEKKYESGLRGDEFERALTDFRQSAGWPIRAVKSATTVVSRWFGPRGRLPGRPVDSPSDVLSFGSAPGDDPRGKTPYLIAELNPPAPPDPDSPERRPLTNDIRPEPTPTRPPNDYGKRRAAMVGMLSGCDRVLAVSEFVGRKFAAMGVDHARIRILPIGSRINRVIALKPDLVFDPPRFERPPRETRPVRLLFLGYNHHYKGLPMFAETLEMLSAEHLRRIDLSVFALGGEGIEWMFRRLEPRLAKLKYAYGYNYHDIPWMMGGKDLTLVPSVWWDNAPQTVFESMACGVPVLGAAVGGIPDFVHDGVNGLLFRGNDRADLKRRLEEVTENPWMLEPLRRNVRGPKSIEAHAVEMERLYAGEDLGAPVSWPAEVVVTAARLVPGAAAGQEIGVGGAGR